jgi:glycosyltransferase involved in cell wall biosynthesis
MALLHPLVDRLLVKSQWQAQYTSKTLGIPLDKFRVAYNGVPLEHYQGPAPARHRHRLVYTSQARRGLDVLLRLFPQIRASFPQSELHIFGVEYNKAGVPSDLAGAVQPGVHWRGSLSKSALARELRAASLMAYPCNFKETFCTAVAEAQAAGLPVVTSGLAALTERVGDGLDGFLIPGKPGKSQAYEPAFLDAAFRLLREDDLWTRMSAAAAEKARRLYDWERIGGSWEEDLQGLVAGRMPHPPRPDPALNLLDPGLLRVTEDGASASVPPALARSWLQQTWTSYGYNPSAIRGLPPG